MKEHYLATLRDRSTPLKEFRQAADTLASLIAAEIASQIKDHQVTIVTILRAGLVFLPPFLELFPEALAGFFGIRRDETTAHPILYYENLPPLSPKNRILLLDPMLATGGSANLALNMLAEKGATNLFLITLLASQEGLDFVKKHHPKIAFYSIAVDPSLDDKKFIVPGLGDFGNRYFGTTS